MDFKDPYKRSQYINFFRNQLLPENFEAHEEKIGIDFQPKFIQKIVKIGEVRSLDMNIYEITHRSENDPRISLSRDSFRLLARYGIKRALILFVSKNSLNYRLSLVTIDLKWEEGKRVQREYSNPRRYSFFLGPETKAHTPETYLITKGRVKDFDDLKERFSLEIVNKDFYTQIAILFTKLAGGERTIGKTKYEGKGTLILSNNTDDKTRKEFSVRLIGRLIFCWFLKKKTSDKGVPLLPEELLSSKAVIRKSDFYHNILEPLFFETLNTPIKERKKEYQLLPWLQIPFLNGGLFVPEDNDYYQVNQSGINALEVPDSWLKELFEIFEIYNFTIDENTPVDVELSIEPEMLGRIFENLLAEINPETGNTARKATGSYYTPRPIVEYMVDESLTQYLLSKTNLDENKIASLLAYEEEEAGLNESEKDSVIDALDVIKIIDPACGSGAFPMGILQKMLLILQKIDPESKKWLKKKISQIEDTIVREEFQKKIEVENWNYVHKLGIIQNSIYGVDIQPIAVDISKLRFFLSLIVDENVDDSKENRGVDWLPNLEFKFVCANSLRGLPELKKHQPTFEDITNVNTENEIKELKKIRDEYFLSYGNKKIILKEKFKLIQSRISTSSIKSNDTSQSKTLSQWDPFIGKLSGWFDYEWMFGVKNGFDIVISNPPYISALVSKKIIDKNIREDYKQKFLSAKGAYDLYIIFIEHGLSILKTNGYLIYITPSKYLSAKYAVALREIILRYSLLKLVDFSKTKVFKNTGVSTLVTIIKKGITSAPIETLKPINENNNELIFEKIFNERNNLNLLPEKIWGFLLSEHIELISKIMLKSNLISEVADVNASSTAAEADEFYGYIRDNSGKDFHKIINTGTIDHIYNHWGRIAYKNRNRYILTPYIDLSKINDRRKLMYKKPKLIFSKIAKSLTATYDRIGEFASTNTNFVYASRGSSLDFLAAYFNSKLADFIYKQLFAGLNMFSSYQFQAPQIRLMPVPKIVYKENEFSYLVENILLLSLSDDYLQNLAKEAKVKEYEKKIDQMVYKLYDLTDDEIKIVEDFHKKA